MLGTSIGDQIESITVIDRVDPIITSDRSVIELQLWYSMDQLSEDQQSLL